jgi:hypothetical protein
MLEKFWFCLQDKNDFLKSGIKILEAGMTIKTGELL